MSHFTQLWFLSIENGGEKREKTDMKWNMARASS